MKTLATTILTTIMLSSPIGVFAQDKVPGQNIFTQNDGRENVRYDLAQLQSREGDRQITKLSQIDDRNKDSTPTKRITRQKSDGISGYAGTTLGIYFPDIDEDSDIFLGSNTDINDGFGGSLFGGVKFNRYVAADLEFMTFTGDIDSDLNVDDENYTVTSVFLNPRFILPLNDSDNSLDLFFSPGLGISTLNSRVEDEVGDFDSTTTIEDDTRFTWQVKGGASVPISSQFSILGQLRYASQTGDDAIDYFGTELGVEFDF